jgi:hypothetical protein
MPGTESTGERRGSGKLWERIMRHAIVTALVTFLLPLIAQAAPLSPEEFLKHPLGADLHLATYDQVLRYINGVASESDRVSIEFAGKSTLDNDIVTVVLTSETNQQNLERYRDIARQLANPDRLSAEDTAQLTAEGKVIALVTCSIHSTEVGSTQMAMEYVYDFATTQDPAKLQWMEDVIVLLMPSINPDGQIMVVDWYNEYLGTDFEGSRMPWLYHHYVGHDNNRDFYQLTQKETEAVNTLLYHRWFPQIFLDEHQMGSTGPRMFVPPQTDPLDPEIHSLIFRETDLIGTNMSYRLEEAGKEGVGHNMIYDSYWPGGTRNTAWWKNVAGLLTEVASARIATPIYIDEGELRGGRKGLPEYDRRSNFPTPWAGGWWRLRDIIDYELIATWALVETSSQYRQEFLQNFYQMGQAAFEAGTAETPFAWVISPEQHDSAAAGKLISLLIEHGVRVFRAEEPVTVGFATYPVGTYVVPAAQPYRAFLITMLRPQRYPEVVPYEGGPIFPPYDVTSWSLPIAMGVEVIEVDKPLAGSLLRIKDYASSVAAPSEGEGGYWISHGDDSAYVAMNRLLEAKLKVYWLETGLPEKAQQGDIYIPHGPVTYETLSEMAQELDLTIRGLSVQPSGEQLRLRPSRVGLYKPWVASMDEGWTRWVLEQYEFPYLNLNNEDIKEGSFKGETDVLLFPDISSAIIRTGEPDNPEARRWWTPLPPKYSGGLGPKGEEAIKKWVEKGGTVVGMDSSTAYLIEIFQLPVTNVLKNISPDEFSAPGTMLRIEVDTSNPIGYGMRPEEAAYFSGSAAFQTSVPDARFERQVIARFPAHRDDIAISGYVKGADLLEKKAAVVEYRVGKGRVILIGFRPQHRAQTLRTFKLLFNSLYLPGLSTEEL